MSVWHWVRHGPTHEKNFVGWRDVPADLSDTARIERLNAYLPGKAILISSDLIRASATADALHVANRKRLPDNPNLREFHFGDWDGVHFSKVAADFPDLSRAYWETPGDIAPPNGESWNAAAARVGSAVNALSLAHPGADFIVVAHIGVILTQMQQAMGVTPYQALSHKIDNLSVSQIKWNGGAASAQIVNHIP
ncbi:MAG: histidine phosphatase family protein [Sulfitobacter sp.]